MAYFVLTSWAANFGLNILFHGVTKVLTNASVEKEMHDKSGPFRPMTDLRMMYPPLLSGLVSAGLLLWFTKFLGFSVSGNVNAGLKLAFALWAIGAGHGCFMDYTCYKISMNVTTHFWMSSFLSSLLNGYLLAKMT